jgi:ethanolamine utilization protein EutN
MMVKGKVIGRLWATRRLSDLPQGALLEVELDSGARLIAFDPLGCGEGERVLVTQGSVAKGWFKDGTAVVDALVVGSLDPTGEAAGKAAPKAKTKKG